MSQTASAPVQTATQSAQTRVVVRKERTGVVVSSKMAKTIVVRVDRRVPHPTYGKIVKVTKKFYAHDDKGAAKEGDRVMIRETRPMSRLKRWELVEVVEKAS